MLWEIASRSSAHPAGNSPAWRRKVLTVLARLGAVRNVPYAEGTWTPHGSMQYSTPVGGARRLRRGCSGLSGSGSLCSHDPGDGERDGGAGPTVNTPHGELHGSQVAVKVQSPRHRAAAVAAEQPHLSSESGVKTRRMAPPASFAGGARREPPAHARVRLRGDDGAGGHVPAVRAPPPPLLVLSGHAASLTPY